VPAGHCGRVPTADELLGADEAARLVAVMAGAAPGLDLAALRAAATASELAPLALRPRAELLCQALLADVPGDAVELDGVVRAALADERCTGWLVWPITEAVTARAVADGSPRALDAALDLLAELTPRLTAEFAIRPLLVADLDRALDAALGWAGHPDEHVRRLATEGTRPFLPWAKRVPDLLARPEATVPILDALYRDPSEYVRRSVANHLNDLNRQQGDLAVAVAGRWLAEADEHTAAVVRRGLRTLVKQGHAGALTLLGFEATPSVAVAGPRLARTSLAVGEELAFEVTLENTGPEAVAVAVDYVVHHVKANGSRTPKVFKLTTRVLAPGEVVTLARRHSFRPISTRRYHPGEHAIEVQVNGTTSGLTPFHLAQSP
jgi:3-methyladenine DNA glycosylase AlkC